jgi:hypothetical protein
MPPSAPAMTVITTTPPALFSRTRGISWSQNIEKYGSTILYFAGRFSQI